MKFEKLLSTRTWSAPKLRVLPSTDRLVLAAAARDPKFAEAVRDQPSKAS